MNDDTFYLAFEEQFRGSRELIKSRLQAYAPLVQALAAHFRADSTLDLGCGRGEWVEIMGDHGFVPHGVDLNDAMLATCHAYGLTAHKANAIDYLKQLPSSSHAIVSSFHMVEHIPFNDLQHLLQESFRVLKPGGILILETPNPENLVVGTTSFYLDPTHQRPIPPALLKFIVEYWGFERTKILRLNEASDSLTRPASTLLDVLSGVSPDYAVVAQKNGPASVMDALTPVFQWEQGLSLDAAASNYQKNQESIRFQMDDQISGIETRLAQAEERAAAAQAQFSRLESHFAQAEERAAAAQARVLDLLSSTSWRVTQPLRWGGRVVRRLQPRVLKQYLKAGLQLVARFIQQRPGLKRMVMWILNGSPRIKSRVHRVIHGGFFFTQPTHRIDQADMRLSAQARYIFKHMQAEQRHKNPRKH